MTVKIYQARESATSMIETVVLCDTCYENWNPAGGITLLAEANKGTPCKSCEPIAFENYLEQVRNKYG